MRQRDQSPMISPNRSNEEAAEAGDTEMVATCDLAFDGADAAGVRTEAIDDAQAANRDS